ncbi:conserved hypothetical protein [Burkholderia mallei PRL-20]|uniref:Uncharacterized protein n=1 Tax=Burkholderia mallei (strain NCTC 10229) TaxID=412022 RepID=A2S147_BURM9|nr:conserved hypothetical protein [Burkholderia mallei SAVP1]ABM99169.2 hypothetical protein BMA10229_1869 [Burkholderia mallei NCTC 10229]ABO02988.1 conserved hypothetical protein [Burkholderia mallei NCTC 10247]EDK55842.1 hypothetical protein BMAFMH_E1000 [Burkholderia mallei FMH]EDK61777.1 hypothetical protein BMAJHU_I0918 [Burkholderia mallei JHU]EDP86996.1 conserved hypothetical protein [Burkholderia mallei ATCC 10399]EEP84921.1 conserved hypothetical protein [Burkholderia mallei GB8 hor
MRPVWAGGATNVSRVIGHEAGDDDSIAARAARASRYRFRIVVRPLK